MQSLECRGCFKPAFNPKACGECRDVKSMEIYNEVLKDIPFDMRPEVDEEVFFEIHARLKVPEKEVQERMANSVLATILARSADAAIYLNKKSLTDCDELKSVFFDLDESNVFITNGDVVIKLSGIDPIHFFGLEADRPVYDYIQERFTPNSTPYNFIDMRKVFLDSYGWSVTVPIQEYLGRTHKIYPEALTRRNIQTVFDIGYGMPNDGIIIPHFDMSSNGVPYQMFGDTVVVPSKASTISRDAIEEELVNGRLTSFACYPMRIDPDGTVVVDVYKVFGDYVVLGNYRMLEAAAGDDLHPFNLAYYAESDLFRFPLTSLVEEFPDLESKARHFKSFMPRAFECEYVYETFLLLNSFGFTHVNLYMNGPDTPMLIEGVRVLPDQPIIEAVIAPVLIGAVGKQCEEALATTTSQGIPF